MNGPRVNTETTDPNIQGTTTYRTFRAGAYAPARSSQQTCITNTIAVCSEKLLMMDRGTV